MVPRSHEGLPHAAHIGPISGRLAIALGYGKFTPGD